MRTFLYLIILVMFAHSVASQELLQTEQIPFPRLPKNVNSEGTAPGPEGRELYPGLFGHSQPIREVYSASTNVFAGVADGKLYIRKHKSDEFTTIAPAEVGWKWDVEAAKWNPEGTKLLVRQIDVRALGTIPLEDETGNKYERTYSYIGDPLEKHQYYIVDVETKNMIRIDHGLEMPFIHGMAWHNGNAYLLRADRMMKQLDLLEVSPEGGVRVLITETSDTYIIGLNLGQHYDNRLDHSKVVEFYEDKIIWTSERSGSRQLYLYSSDGNLIRELTNRQTNGIVGELSMVVEGWAYFDAFEIAVGNKERLMDAKFYRCSIESGEITKISDGPGILDEYWSVKKDRFWLLHAGLDQIKIEEYNTQGERVNTFWEYTLEENKTFGYDPEYVWTKTPDGAATMGSAILKPVDFDQGTTYPVVEYIYAPPFYNVMPYHAFDRRSRQLQDLANQGFIIVLTDARGTDLRGRKYQEYSYGRLGQVEIQDHAYVLEQLSKDRPYMDMSRVGIMGHSMGGYFSLRAMILRPDLYKVGHINAPNVDPEKFRVPLEPYFGCLPIDCPDVYAAATVSDRLDQLQGRILLTFGTADQHIPISEVYRLTAAMDAVGFDKYQLDIYEGMHHQVHQDPRWYPRMVTFFEQELKEKSNATSAEGND